MMISSCNCYLVMAFCDLIIDFFRGVCEMEIHGHGKNFQSDAFKPLTDVVVCD